MAQIDPLSIQDEIPTLTGIYRVSQKYPWAPEPHMYVHTDSLDNAISILVSRSYNARTYNLARTLR